MATGCRSMCAIASHSPQDNDLSTHAHACIQVHNVLVVHANTSVRDEPADRSRIVGAVDGVLAAAAECQGCRTHRIRTAAARNDRRQPGIIFPDRFGGLPGGADIFAVGGAMSGPGHARFAAPDPITDRLALACYVVKVALIRLDHNSSSRIAIQANRFPGVLDVPLHRLRFWNVLVNPFLLGSELLLL